MCRCAVEKQEYSKLEERLTDGVSRIRQHNEQELAGLTEENMISIYSCGHSRIPVFERDPKKPKNVALIRGVLMTKNLIVVNFNDQRPLATLPLLTPLCVSPRINLVDLLNLFQTGTVGHLALVCTRPKIAAVSLKAGKAIPEKAGYMG